jgi:hypothetical protein
MAAILRVVTLRISDSYAANRAGRRLLKRTGWQWTSASCGTCCWVALRHSGVAAGRGVQCDGIAYLAAMRELPKGTPWWAADDVDLRTAIAGGATVDDATSFLCRTPDDFAIRAAVLGLRWHEFFH